MHLFLETFTSSVLIHIQHSHFPSFFAFLLFIWIFFSKFLEPFFFCSLYIFMQPSRVFFFTLKIPILQMNCPRFSGIFIPAVNVFELKLESCYWFLLLLCKAVICLKLQSENFQFLENEVGWSRIMTPSLFCFSVWMKWLPSLFIHVERRWWLMVVAKHGVWICFIHGGWKVKIVEKGKYSVIARLPNCY